MDREFDQVVTVRPDGIDVRVELHLARLWTDLPILMTRAGLEPATYGLKVRCSTS